MEQENKKETGIKFQIIRGEGWDLSRNTGG